MNINNYVMRKAVDSFRENIVRTLTNQQQKILGIVLAAFCFLAVVYTILKPSSLQATKIASIPENHQTIYFYDKDKSYYELTNFYENWRGHELHTVRYANREWKTSEHAFQAEKFNYSNSQAQHIREQIATAPSAREAFKIAQNNKDLIGQGWHSVKDSVMLDILRSKFSDPHLRNVLKKTGNRTLVEASPVDPYWGYGSDRKGLNKLGTLLMQVRKEIFG
jgi:N-glycosidase YbiA